MYISMPVYASDMYVDHFEYQPNEKWKIKAMADYVLQNKYIYVCVCMSPHIVLLQNCHFAKFCYKFLATKKKSANITKKQSGGNTNT